ncbi:MAG TPA: molecular chaperone DnaK [Chloroflexi bacterium]|jgi:RNA polymerase-binding protein DksA|nr:molecular chaperone DnaK [Chloroflexota bacterium]
MEIKAKSKNIDDLKAYLVAERKRLQKEISRMDITARTDENEGTGYSNHMAENATAVFEQARNAGIKRHQEILLAEVNDALQRIAEGTYGVCRRCGRSIDAARLKAQPTASYCFNCKRDLESR